LELGWDSLVQDEDVDEKWEKGRGEVCEGKGLELEVQWMWIERERQREKRKNERENPGEIIKTFSPFSLSLSPSFPKEFNSNL